MSRFLWVTAAATVSIVACSTLSEKATNPPSQRGAELFATHCALCHGERADGRGLRRAALSSSPVDFTRKSWCRGTTPRAVYHVVREGVRGTAMPGWKALSEDQCWDLVAYLLAVCEHGS